MSLIQDLLGLVLDGACLISPETGRVIYANRPALDLLGYAPTEMGQISLEQLLVPLPITGLEGPEGYRFQSFRGELRLRRRDQGLFPAQVHLVRRGDQIILFFKENGGLSRQQGPGKRRETLRILADSIQHYLDSRHTRFDYPFAGEQLRRLTGSLAVLIMSYDEVAGEVLMETVAGDPRLLTRAEGVLGYQLPGSSWRVAEERLRQFITEEILQFQHLEDLIGEQIPVAVCRDIETALGLGKVYTVSLTNPADFIHFGVILMPAGADLEEIDAVRIFSRFSTAALTRKEAETALYESEQLYQSLFEHSGDAIFVLERNGRMARTNEAACLLLGYDHEELVGMEFATLVQDSAGIADPAIPWFGGNFLGEVTLAAKDGRQVPVEINTTVLPDGNILGIARDVRERKAAAAAQRDREAAEEREKTRIRFLQIAAHELRNPMAGIKGGLSLLRYRINAGRPLGDISRIALSMEREIDRLSGLLDEILDAIRIQEGQFPMSREPINLVRVIRSGLKEYQHNDSYRITHNLADAPTCLVSGDYNRLVNVVRSLVHNAIKYSPEQAEVLVQLHTADGWALLSVRDQGMGIPPDQLETIFEGFFRASNIQRYRDPGGLGLGLFICKDIVTQHAGEIWAESEPGQGAVVYVKLPLYKGQG